MAAARPERSASSGMSTRRRRWRRLRADPDHPLRARAAAARLRADLWRRRAGGRGLSRRSARARCVPIYNALDPATHHPVPPDAALRRRSRLPRQPPARPRGAGRGVLPAPRPRNCRSGVSCSAARAGTTSRCRANVRAIGHVCTREHNAFNCSALAVLNVARDSMAEIGFSPATRVFEAAGAGACLITDAWEGIELFLNPDEEVLVARDGAGCRGASRGADAGAGAARSARRRAARILAGHTYARRARGGGRAAARGAGAQARERAPHEARRCASWFSASASARPGATATRRPIARCCRRSPGAATTSCSWSVMSPGMREHRDLPDRRFLRAALLRRSRRAGALARSRSRRPMR